MLSRTKQQLFITILSLSATVHLAGCAGGDIADKSNAVTRQGTMDVENLKVGMPEANLQKAVFSFALDDNPISHTGGKNQYMARNKTKDGATLLAQCKGGNCYELQRLYRENPISKEDGIAEMKKMLPDDAPAQSRVDDKQMSDSKIKNPSEHYYFGDEYLGEITYTPDKKVFAVTLDKLSYMKEGAKEASTDEGKETKSDK